jgi:hypothetical protein
VGFIDVYQNGVLLGSADYTATSGLTVVLAIGATVGDLVEVISFQVSSILNAVPTTGGTFSGNVLFDSGDGIWNTAGNVGIGTTSPTNYANYKNLEIRGSTTSQGGVVTLASSDASINGLVFTDTNGLVLQTNTNHPINFRTNGTTTRMTIDSSGRVTTPFQPAFLYGFSRASVVTAPTVVSTTNGFTIATDRNAFQVGSGFSTSTGRFTAPVAGTYVFGMSMMRDNTAASQLDFRVHKNGGGAASTYSRVYWGAYSTSYQQNASTTLIQLSAGDFIEFVPSSGSFYNDDSYIFGYLLG